MNDNDVNLLELERDKFRSLTAHVREGIIMLTPEQQVYFANEKACEMTGYTQEEMLGKQAFEVLYLISSNDQVIDMNQVCPTGGLDMDGVIYKESRVSLVGKTDIIKVVNVQSIKIKRGSHINLGAMVVLDDVFEESELERMKTDFVSMAVHMLRTPLTVVKGFLHNLAVQNTLSKLSESEAEDLKMSISGAEELDRLVENLLHMSQIQQGTFRMKIEKVSYSGLIENIVQEYKPYVESKGLKLVYVPPIYELPYIKIDFQRIKEVIKNLLDNAVKFTDQGGIEITVAKEENVLHTTIKDTGRGMPPNNIEYIFTKFYRIKDPLSMEKGLGLGLYVSKQIIAAHKGKIWADSIEGQGSIFHFTLPCN